ncbi:MAG: DUF3105 domain-containing protein [Actinobacteria bacterium]|nr:DUF3105 domain-containing protein [Actinomycetota bacterium]
MARKDRVPNPPKPRVQAPRRRHTPSDQAALQRNRRTLFLVGGGALVLAALVAAIIFVTGRGSGGERAALEDADCTLQSYPGLEGAHLQELHPKTRAKWNSFPPTSGVHYVQPAVWDFYTDPVLLVQSVHNLEHGGIVIHYGEDVPEEQVDELREFYLDDPNGLLVAPLPALKSRIALSAWTTPDEGASARTSGRGWLALCPRFDEDAFSAFVDEHRYKGPERFEPDTLTPGS